MKNFLYPLKVAKSDIAQFEFYITENHGGSACHFTRWRNAKKKAERMVVCVNEFKDIPDPELFMNVVKDLIRSEDFSCYCHSDNECSLHVLKDML